jgi:intein/homing endonuclease
LIGVRNATCPGRARRFSSHELIRPIISSTKVIDGVDDSIAVDEKTLAYFAGLFDGEGCINVAEVKPRPGRRSPSFQTVAQVSMTDRRSLDLLLDSFGGSIRRTNKVGARPIWVWRVYHKAAKLFLEDILPYLVVKKLQAELLIELENGVPGRGVQRSLSVDEIERRRKIKVKICALNGPSLYAEYLKTVEK